MRKLTTLFLLIACSFGIVVDAQEDQKPTQQARTVQDIDTQIAQLKKDIARYKGMASMYGEQAQLVEFRDFEGYRDATTLQNRCLAIVSSMTEHLQILEKQRASLAAPNK